MEQGVSTNKVIMPHVQGQKYRWYLPTVDHDVVRQLAFKHNVSEPIAEILYTRGFTTDALVQSFLFSSYEKDVAHSGLLKGADIAVARILQAIERKEKILIFGDYDVDGITSTSIMLVSLLPLGANINYFLPNRKRDGYGLSAKVVRRAVENKYSLIVTVDNGITAYEAANVAKELGIDLVITDHHKPHDHLPPALTIVNPQQADCAFPHKTLAGVGVIFKIMSLLYERLGKTLPEKVYELLMLGTVADVVPLTHENRFWVQHGLAKTNKKMSSAFAVLASNAQLTKERFNSLDIGFMIAPQLNALGRLDDPRDAVKFMISSDFSEVLRIGSLLKSFNEERKKIDRAIYDEVEGLIKADVVNVRKDHVIIASSSEWPAGVIGLVAGKLMHNYGRPAILLHKTDKGIAKGSCRSIPEINIFEALTQAQDLLIQFGGHACAAGLAVEQKNIEALKERLNNYVSARFAMEELQPKITVDATIDLPVLTKNFIEDLARLEPFGNQNPQPLFKVDNVVLVQQPQILKEKHVKCMVFESGVLKPLVFFNRPELAQQLVEQGDKPFSVVANVTVNEWNGRSNIELMGVDISLGSTP